MADAPRFRLRTGAPSWDRICSVDIDRVMDGVGAGTTLSNIVDDVTFANISRRELKSAGYDAAESLVKLLQLCVEYMLHVQASLGNDAAAAERGRRKALDETLAVESKLSLERARRRAAARQCVDFREVALALAGAARAAGVDTARWIDALRDGDAANDDEALLGAYTDTSVGCAQCGKGFASKAYLAQHVTQVHGAVDAPPPAPPSPPNQKKRGFFSSVLGGVFGPKEAARVERTFDLTTVPGTDGASILSAVQAAKLDADEVAFACETRGGKLVLIATAPASFDAWQWLAEELQGVFSAPEPPCTLRITVEKGEGLVVKDWALRKKDKSSDPYVVVKVNGKKVGTTEVVKKSLDPEWGFTLECDVQAPQDADIELKIWDKDLVSSNAMGAVTLKGLQRGDVAPEWYEVQATEDCKDASGRLRCGAAWSQPARAAAGPVKDLRLRKLAKAAESKVELVWDLSGASDAAAVQRAVDDAKLDADEVSLTVTGDVLIGVAPASFDAWAWLDEELQRLLAGVVRRIALRDATPRPAEARALDDAIRALEGVAAARPGVGPALELLKKERRALSKG